MTDNRMKDRVKGLLGGTLPPGEAPSLGEHPGQTEGIGMDASHKALHVLTLAQRTADQHIATAHEQAAKIHTSAQEAAEQIAREAQMHAHKVRQEADKTLAEARQAAEQSAREARARAEEAQRQADKVLSDAQARAEAITADAQANADERQQQAEQRYQDVVGGLAAKREALQLQIEALEQFDRDYRARLTTFMQGQLRALWVDEPQVTGELNPPPAEPATGTVPEQRPNGAATTEPALKGR